MPSRSEPLLAIILSPKRVTVVEASLADGELHVSAVGDIEPPQGAFDGGQIASGETLGRVLADFMAGKQITARNIRDRYL